MKEDSITKNERESKMLNAEEPAPIANPAQAATWDLILADVKALVPQGPHDRELLDLVVADMVERDQIGAAKYGVRHTAHNGRDHLVDAYQELLDACVYLRAHLAEDQTFTSVFYMDVLVRTIELRRAIDGRNLKKS